MCHMTRRLALLLLVLVGLAVTPYPRSPAAAGCVAPELIIGGDPGSRQQPVELRRGQQVTVDGRYFHDGCDDTGGGDAFGCTTEDREPTPPMRDIELVLMERQSDASGIPLAVADADAGDEASWTFTVPADAPLGRGVLRTQTSGALFVRVS